MYNSNYSYFLGTPYTDSTSYVWAVLNDGGLSSPDVYSNGNPNVVRPVITISKSALSA